MFGTGTDSLAMQVLDLHAQALRNRASYEGGWRELAEHIFPQHGFQISPGQRLGTRIYDGTPIWAVQILVNALHSTATPPSILWFEIETANEKLMERFEVRQWLYKAARDMFKVMTSSNFHSAVHECYLDLVLFGNNCLYAEPDDTMLISYSARPMSEVAWLLNSRNQPDILCREFKMSLRQMRDMFGEQALSDKKRKLLADPKKLSTEYKVSHITMPRKDTERFAFNPKRFPYASVYTDIEEKHVLLESGYHEFPYGCGRWSVTSGETYGRGPGDWVLPDARQLHMVQKHTLRAVQKATDPAIMMPDKMFINHLRTSAGAVNTYRGFGSAAQNPHHAVLPLPTGSQFPVAHQEKEDLRTSIARGFFVDQLRLPNNDRMTKAEVMQRVQENLQTLAPVMGRSNEDLFIPIIARTFAILERAGYFDPLPEVLRGQPMRVKFTSPMSKTQKLSDMQALVGAFDAIAPIAQIDPAILNEIDKNKSMRFIWENAGAPLSCIITPEQSAENQRRDKEQQAQQQETERAAALSGSIKDIAGATKDFAGAQQMRSGPMM